MEKFFAKWNGETIISRIAELRECGFSKEEIADLLYEKINDYGPSFSNEHYLITISTSDHLYSFLCRECLEYIGDGRFLAGCESYEIPFDVEKLLRYGADKKVIAEWIADHMTWRLFDKDFQEELCKYDIFPSEEQIVSALGMRYNADLIRNLMEEDCGEPNPLFMSFMDDSDNPYELISKLDDISNREITDYCEYYGYGASKNNVMQLPDFWKSVAILFLQFHRDRMLDSDELQNVLQILDWLQIDESEWKKVLSGYKNWIEECIKDFEENPDDYVEKIKLLKKIIKFAS